MTQHITDTLVVAITTKARLTRLAAIAIVLTAACGSASADVLLESDFSSSNWFESWQDNTNFSSLRGEPDRTNRITADSDVAGFVPLDGPALMITILKGTNEGTGLSFYPRTVLGHDPSDLHLRYYLRFGSDWANTQNGKLPGFGGTYDVGGWAGKPSNGSNGWSARGKFGDPCSNGKISVASYVYHADMQGEYGESFSWTNGCNNGLNRNQWYAIEYHVKLNTPGQRDGLLQGWIDGVLVMEAKGLRFDDTGQKQIERVWMNLYHGGQQVASQDMHVFYDSIVVADHYIGPGTTATPNFTPNPPQALSIE